MIKPIRPEDIPEQKAKLFPPEVMKTWNDFIIKNYSNGRAFIKQDDIATAIANRLSIPRSEVFNNGYLDVEDTYRAHGWKVEYDKPGYNESYPANFTFRKS